MGVSSIEDLIEVQNEISYIKSTDSDIKSTDLGNPSQSDFDMMKDILLDEKLRKEYELIKIFSVDL